MTESGAGSPRTATGEPTARTLLTCTRAKELELVKIAHSVSTLSAECSPNLIKDRFKDLFSGIGKPKGIQVELHEDKSVPPVTQPHRRIPYHVRQKTEKELSRLVELDLIEPVGDEPTP